MTFTYDAAQDCLLDKTILITGASDGIGRVVAAEFCARGANVIALGRSQEKLEALPEHSPTPSHLPSVRHAATRHREQE